MSEKLECYVPFGKEWEKEMMKFTKPQLINLLRKAYLKNKGYSEEELTVWHKKNKRAENE